MKWTIEDFQSDLCELGDVGKPRPQAEPPPADPASVEVVPMDQSLSAILSQHSREVYIELGGKDYLRRNPQLLNKVLLKQVEPPRPIPVTLEERMASMKALQDEMPWISARRLMYQMESRYAEDIAPKDSLPAPGPLPAEPAAEAPSTAAQHEFPASDTRLASPAPRASTDVRKEHGPRGSARGK